MTVRVTEIYLTGVLDMRKKSVALVLAAAVLGAAGAFLRRRQLDNIFEEYGLAVKGAPETTAAVVFAAAAAVLLAVFAILIVRGRSIKEDVCGALTQTGPSMAAHIVAALAVCAGVLFTFGGREGISAGVPGILFMLGGVLTAFVLAVQGFSVNKGSASAVRIFAAIPTLFMCWLLILLYKADASNPVLAGFAFECVAVGFAALAYFERLAVAFGRAKPVPAAALSVVAAFLMTAAAGGFDSGMRVAAAGFALDLLAGTADIVRNME